ncbi:hypothetical protein GQ55_4G125800 [Panicum hallii var. hallii]|uniref:Uncharacterized protein n=1 Tax=Panicum hallii var. hallii TaxID=1504633 RepID=A0A2T7DXX5_9POAL|nr:hypothetical protein GQ55_4G125800 [Panicum hallii var. hallii]
MLSRMTMVGIVSLLVCTLVALTSGAANVWWTDEVAFANEEDGNNLQKQQHHEFTGYQPRLVSFNRASDQANGEKRKVPAGPNREHNEYPTSPPYRHERSIASPSPSGPIEPPHNGIIASAPYGDDNNKRTSPGPSDPVDPPHLGRNRPPTWATLY